VVPEVFLVLIPRALFVGSLALVAAGLAAIDWRLASVVVGGMLWWDLHRPAGEARR